MAVNKEGLTIALGTGLAKRHCTTAFSHSHPLREECEGGWGTDFSPGDVAKVEIGGVYYHGVDPVTAFVLAGGKSSRMGLNKDKALLQTDGRTLLEHSLGLAQAAAGRALGNTWIVGSAEKFAGFGPVVEDIYPGQGPLSGIHAALTASASDLNLMIAVDMPFLHPEFLSYLIKQARGSTATVVVPKTTMGLQPLAAVYRREFAAFAERSLQAGQNKIALLFPEVQTRVIEPEELEENGFSEELFRNLNTEQEWLEAQPKLIAR